MSRRSRGGALTRRFAGHPRGKPGGRLFSRGREKGFYSAAFARTGA